MTSWCTVGAKRRRLTAVVMYWPPKPSRRAEKSLYAPNLSEMALDQRHSTPHIMTDLNDRMGVPVDGDGEHAAAVELAPESDGLAATQVLRILQDDGMVVLNTFQVGEPTFASNWKLSRIDHVAAPAHILDGLAHCRVPAKERRRLQLACWAVRHDHWSLSVSVRWCLRGQASKPVAR